MLPPLTIIAALTLVPAVAFADDAADRHLAAGLDKFEAGDYETAIEQFRVGHAAEARPEFLFALGQAERLSGDCPSAVSYYEQFLAEAIADEQRQAALELVATCRRALESHPDGVRATAPSEAAPAAPVAVQTPPEKPSPWYRDQVGNALAAASLVSLAVGTTYLIRAGSASDEARSAPSYDEFQRGLDTAGQRRTIATASISVGAVLGGAALWRYWRAGEKTRLDVAASGRGASVSVTGSF